MAVLGVVPAEERATEGFGLENVVFLGPPGVGKTQLAISLAIAAAERRSGQ